MGTQSPSVRLSVQHSMKVQCPSTLHCLPGCLPVFRGFDVPWMTAKPHLLQA